MWSCCINLLPPRQNLSHGVQEDLKINTKFDQILSQQKSIMVGKKRRANAKRVGYIKADPVLNVIRNFYICLKS